MNFEYKNWMADEYPMDLSLKKKTEYLRKLLYGKTVKDIYYDKEAGFICVSFMYACIYIWICGKNCKIKLSRKTVLPDDIEKIDDEKLMCSKAKLISFKLLQTDRIIGFRMDFAEQLFSYSDNEQENVNGYSILIKEEERGIQISVFGKTYNRNFKVVSEKKIPMTENLCRMEIVNLTTGKVSRGISDEKGYIKIFPVYHNIELGNYRTGDFRIQLDKNDNRGKDGLYGACDSLGREIIPCEYQELMCMRNGYFLVMDDASKWWVLDRNDRAVYGPSVYGADIYNTSREYLSYIQYNSEIGCECLGLYNVKMKTVTTKADYIKITALSENTFKVAYINKKGDIEETVIDGFGNIIQRS